MNSLGGWNDSLIGSKASTSLEDGSITRGESSDTPVVKHTLTLKMNHDSSYGSLDPAVGEHEYAEGTVVTITATAADGKEFDGWNDGPRDNPRTVTITEDMTLQANFS